MNRLISVEQAAAHMGISRNTAYRMARSRQLPGLLELPGRRMRVRASVLAASLNGGREWSLWRPERAGGASPGAPTAKVSASVTAR
ncbi:MAG: helix-turn-helix domain-containing protein [Chloroflexi bacterium]|nr:helix-turn-helix domain-containing protein [Chloroflexota bacterium]